jgi:hypothetical protein
MQTKKQQKCHKQNQSILNDRIVTLAKKHAVGSEIGQVESGNAYIIRQVLKRTALFHGGVR